MRLRNAILAGLMFGMAHGLAANAGEEKITKGYNSMDAMGCICLLYTSPSPRDRQKSRMPSSA